MESIKLLQLNLTPVCKTLNLDLDDEAFSRYHRHECLTIIECKGQHRRFHCYYHSGQANCRNTYQCKIP